MTQGAWTAKRLVTDYLAWDMPRRVVALREAWGVDDDTLPLPEVYLAHEPPALDHWPSILTVAMSTSRIERIDYEDGLNPLYRCTYSMRTYVWVRHELPEGVTEVRDRLAAVLRTSLLDRPTLARSTGSSGLDLAIDEGSLREEFSDLTYVKGDRAVAGAYLAYDLRLDELLARADVAEVADLEIHYDATGNPTAAREEFVEDVVVRTITD